MKKLMTILALAIGLGTGYNSKAQSLFTGDEVNLLAFGSYIDQTDEHWSGGVGFSYFFSRLLGIGATTRWEDFHGSFIDNVSGEGYLRLPLGDSPLAPYGIGTAGYTWEYDTWFFAAGAGAEFRFSKELGLFSDIQWLFNENGDDDGVMVRLGIRLGM